MTSSTKEKIRIAALELFNRDGLVNVRLQHIADEAFISVGNLAYHYPNKESILSALYERLTMQQKALLAEFRIVPLFDNIDRLIQQTFMLQRKYVFFYFDTLEIIRAYPKIGEAHQDHISSQISQLKIILDFNTSRGALNAEPINGLYDKLATQIWMTMDLWTSQQAILGKAVDDAQNYRLSIWNLIIPHFTVLGMREYEQMLKNPYDFYY